jgi:hypothetical protein
MMVGLDIVGIGHLTASAGLPVSTGADARRREEE